MVPPVPSRVTLGSPGLTGLFDVPWIPFYLAIVFLLHPWLGFLALGAMALACLWQAASAGDPRPSDSRCGGRPRLHAGTGRGSLFRARE